MTETLYRREVSENGRVRYVETCYRDHDWENIPVGVGSALFVRVGPGCQTKTLDVKPDLAAVEAAIAVFREALSRAIDDRRRKIAWTDGRGTTRTVTITPELRAALDREAIDDGRGAWQGATTMQIVDAAAVKLRRLMGVDDA